MLTIEITLSQDQKLLELKLIASLAKIITTAHIILHPKKVLGHAIINFLDLQNAMINNLLSINIAQIILNKTKFE